MKAKHDEALAAYRTQTWDAATSAFDIALALPPAVSTAPVCGLSIWNASPPTSCLLPRELGRGDGGDKQVMLIGMPVLWGPLALGPVV